MNDGSGAHAPHSGSQPALLVSACLLGVRCNHLGSANTSDAVVALASTHRVIAVCPESVGGLPTPRPAAELGDDGRVRTADGTDVTQWYERGAAHALQLATAAGATRAVLKARSPSCGCHETYDGTFTRTRVVRDGVTAATLRRAGLEVVSEEDL
jgi:uncharacterized protein YbbK (DUF523 family)